MAGSCGLVDVAATILDLAGVAPGGPLDGVSLVPAANGRAAGHPVFAEEDRKATDARGVRGLRALSVRTEKAKYVLTYDLKTSEVMSEELYDLSADAAETHAAPLENLARYGDPFCRGVARVRSLVPGFAPTGACAK